AAPYRHNSTWPESRLLTGEIQVRCLVAVPIWAVRQGAGLPCKETMIGAAPIRSTIFEPECKAARAHCPSNSEYWIRVPAGSPIHTAVAERQRQPAQNRKFVGSNPTRGTSPWWVKAKGRARAL